MIGEKISKLVWEVCLGRIERLWRLTWGLGVASAPFGRLSYCMKCSGAFFVRQWTRAAAQTAQLTKVKKDSITCWSPYITFQSKNEYFKSPSDVRWSQRKAKWFFLFVFFSLSYVLFGQFFRSIELLLNFTYELLFQQSFCYITIKSESFSIDKMLLISWTILTRVKFPSRIALKVDIKFALSIYMYPV